MCCMVCVEDSLWIVIGTLPENCVHVYLSVQVMTSVSLTTSGVLDDIDSKAFDRTWDDLHEHITLRCLSILAGIQFIYILENEMKANPDDLALASRARTYPFNLDWDDRWLGSSRRKYVGDVAYILIPWFWSSSICSVTPYTFRRAVVSWRFCEIHLTRLDNYSWD